MLLPSADFWREAMAIYRLLQNSAFVPEDIGRLVAAYENCLRILNLSDRSDPITELIAKKVIEVAQTGMRDPARIGQLALEEIGMSGGKGPA